MRPEDWVRESKQDLDTQLGTHPLMASYKY